MDSNFSYVSLFNKYRPMLLSEIVGQEVVVTTVKNSILTKQIPNSFLFYGSYGVGKTTIARAIARCVNCSSGITIKPCLTCDSCISITNSSHPDVIEMDAASTNGVDNIRNIIENTKYAPIFSRFKIYILDEVHMLSISAFNALLKTLEEPVQNVKFILATTEINKIPFTIVSRCQRFKLCKVKKDVIISNLKNILNKEHKHYDEVGLNIIAKNSNGSIRDSLSLAEKYLMYSNELTANSLQTFEKNDISELWVKIFDNDVKSLLTEFNHDDNHIEVLNQMLQNLHFIVQVKLDLNLENNEFYDCDKEIIKNKFSNVDLELISRIWKVLDDGIKELHSAINIYASTEMLLMRLCYISSLPSPKEIIEKYFQNDNCQENLNDSKLNYNHENLNEKQDLVLKTENKSSQSNVLHENMNFQQIKNLLINEERFSCIFNKKAKRIGILNNTLTIYTEEEIEQQLIEEITQFLNNILKKDWKVEVINLQNNEIVQKILKEFNGAKIVYDENC